MDSLLAAATSFSEEKPSQREFNILPILNICKVKFTFLKSLTPPICQNNPRQSTTIMKKIQVPCYLRNGGKHQIVNVPFGIFTRVELRKLVHELLSRQKTLQTFFAAEATPRTIALLQGLEHILSMNLKPKAIRQKEKCWYAANEKNLRQLTRQCETDEVVYLVQVACSCGLIIILFLIAAHLDFLQSTIN